MDVRVKDSFSFFLEFEFYYELISDGFSNVIVEVRNFLEKIFIELLKGIFFIKKIVVNKSNIKIAFNFIFIKGKIIRILFFSLDFSLDLED